MTKRYVKIALNELKVLIESDILLNHFYKNDLYEWKNYNDAFFSKKELLNKEVEDYLKENTVSFE